MLGPLFGFALIDAKKTSSHRIDTLSNNKAEIREYINTKRHMYGNDYFLRQMNLKSIVNKTLVIVRSLKTVAEVDYIHSIGGRVVGLTADQHIRYNRSQNEEALQGFNFEYFKTLEKTEFPEMDEAYEKADYKYVNNYQKTSKKDEVDLFHIGPCSDVLNKIAYMYPELDRDHDRFDAKFEDFLMKHA